MKLIIVTRWDDGEKMYVNPEQICAIYPCYKKESTVIQFARARESYLDVKESPESIVNMITDKNWIPCDQKLPNDDKPVLLTEEIRFQDGRRRRDVCMASYDPQNMTWYEILGANILEIPHPIAWMKLPKPYQEESKYEID